MERSDVYAYPYEGNLYINLTNRCTNNCEFCVRRGADGVGGHYLWIKKEPTAQEVIEMCIRDSGSTDPFSVTLPIILDSCIMTVVGIATAILMGRRMR